MVVVGGGNVLRCVKREVELSGRGIGPGENVQIPDRHRHCRRSNHYYSYYYSLFVYLL